ncbi:survival protein sure-like phosphatase/nucleotidase [Fomitopsis serialis]|uniref:survival protein sure-like phosphatase/nucleotidase n=1 Tax=Fomitopsis serialis TaxID=139415 RepID=UPI00200722AF|nr:survival protein sure-like phosphatase/nucleotidase [Neoantrodia serialis]KAH9922174.1 survival protein sure-like phosphatase/nucleotidase [Neoantrodia serialis]
MSALSKLLVFVALSFSTVALATNIVLTNDDGWAVAQIRAQYADLVSAGYDVILSCPAENESGTGSDSETPEMLTEPCEYDTCPTGSPAEGYNSTDNHLNYVNAYPVDAVRYGIQTLAPELFDGAEPDFIVSGPNIGWNTGKTVLKSGTVGAACEAAKEGYPATAFSGRTGSQKSYTNLTSDPSSSTTKSAFIYAALTVQYTNALLASGSSPLLPSGVIVNVNYPSTKECSDADDYQWVFARNLANSSATDFETCGSTTLPTEKSVVKASGCYASVSVLNATTKTDVDAYMQGQVYNSLTGLPFSCLSSS